MGVIWTEEQQKVISLRGRNILVSAAAGSGKTAVLVERILSKICDPKKPVDIDRLLIMTFTRAAAGEMKERISAAIDQKLYDNPDNEHIQRQVSLIHNAQITTIDGFCAYIIRNYFHMIDLDPGYRTAEEGELKTVYRAVAFLNKDRPDDQFINSIPDICQSQRRITPQILVFQVKQLFQLHQIRFHFTPSRVSFSSIPLSRSNPLISSALAKSFAFLAA